MSGFFPGADVAPLLGGPVLGWGVVAPGEIADAFTRTIHCSTSQRVVAVGSRSAERAAGFAARHGIRRSYGDYAELVADPSVDIVYVAAPHTEHARLALLAIGAGKSVLVEKPLATSHEDGVRIADAARAAGVFAGEAMWTAYLPQSSVLRQLIDRGSLGEVRLATADVGWAAGPDPAPRFVDPGLGGGTVLDAGVYGFWFAQSVIGRPERVHSVGTVLATGADEQVATVLGGSRGRAASVTSTLAGTSTGLASVIGSAGTARFLEPFVFPARLAVTVGGEEHVWNDDSGLVNRDGLAWQAVQVARFVADGLLDSPVHPLSDALDVLGTMDEVRLQVLGAARRAHAIDGGGDGG